MQTETLVFARVDDKNSGEVIKIIYLSGNETENMFKKHEWYRTFLVHIPQGAEIPAYHTKYKKEKSARYQIVCRFNMKYTAATYKDNGNNFLSDKTARQNR